MAKITLPNGQTVEIDSSGNILNPGGSIFTGGGAAVPTVTPDPVQTVSLTQQTFGADNKPIDEQRTTNYNSVDNPQNFSRGGGSTLRAAAPTAPIITRSVGVSSQNSLVGANSGGGDGSEGGSGSDGVQKKKEEYITLENERGEKRIIYNPEINKANIASLEASGFRRTGTQPRTFETPKSAAEEYADTFTPPETAEQIRDRKTKAAADLIKTTNEFYQSKLNEQNEVNQLRTREANAQSVLSGLMGSTEAGNKLIGAADKNSKANQSILAEKALALSEIYYDIQTSAEEEASKQREDAMTNAKDIIARKAERQKKGVEQATLLAKSGFDLKGIRDNDPVTYNHLLESAGGEKELEAYFTLNRPIENIVDKQIKDGKYVIAYQNPLTGKITIETADLGLPVGYSKTVDAGNRILAIPDNWDGSPDKLITINKGLTPEQALKNAPGGTILGKYPADIQAAATSILEGKSKLNEYPSAKRLQINAAMTELYTAEGGNELGQGAYDAAVELKDHKGLSAAVGTNFLLGAGKRIPGTDSAGFLAKLDQLIANIKLVNIKYLKGTGALSDAEGATLEKAGTSLDPSLPEEDFEKELTRVITALSKAKGIKTEEKDNSGAIPKGTDGASYGYPGYVSDGTQWVLK